MAVGADFIATGHYARLLFDSTRNRYLLKRAKGSPAVIIPLDRDKARVHFYKPQRAITPGQAVVCYRDDFLVGRGIISKRIQGWERYDAGRDLY